MSIQAVPVQRAVSGAPGVRCARLRTALLAVSFIILGLLALRPFCVPDFAAGNVGSRAPAGLSSWAVPGGIRLALREKGPCSLGFKPGAVLTTAQSTMTGLSRIAGFAPLAPAPAGPRSFARLRAPAKSGFLADPPLRAFYARSVRILR